MFGDHIFLVYFTAFLTGVLGGVHCVGMCGGIIFALFSALPKKDRYKMYLYYTCYNIGRVFSYSLVGFLAGFLGIFILDLTGSKFFYIIRLIGGFSLLGIGLYLGGWLSALSFLERVGWFIWIKVYPYMVKITPIKKTWHAILLGMFWGNIPCGLVYATLIWSLSSGSYITSTFLMMVFGIGTLPVMFVSIFFISSFKNFFKNKFLKLVVCFTMSGFGVLTILNAAFSNNCH